MLFIICSCIVSGECSKKEKQYRTLDPKELDNEQSTYTVASLFWICNDNEKNNNTARLLDMRGITKDTYKEFTGNKIPIRLVRKK